MKTKSRIILLILYICLAAAFLSACSSGGSTPSSTATSSASPAQTSTASPAVTPSAEATPASASASIPPAVSPTAAAIVYHNADYGFDFNLPKDWDGYTVVPQKWEGTSLTGDGKIVATGPKLLIRNPKWTAASPMQDIPIMVFTLEQWDSLQREEFAVSAAPIGPSELGRNSKFVFALPARYNFAFLTGFEEVEDIMNTNPLHAF
jgi:hypothetical protein